MKQDPKERPPTSRVAWDTLEEHFRGSIERMVQDLLEAELSEVLGRGRYVRKEGVTDLGYRNGHGKSRRLGTPMGTITVHRPRARDLDERFESRILPAFKKRTNTVENLLPDLYLHGLALGDFDRALRGLLGEAAPLSPSTIERLKAKWGAEYEAWRTRSLKGLELVYMWVDGVYVKAGLEKEKAAVLVVIGALSDGTKVVLAVEAGHRESTEAWAAVLRDLKGRGLNSPRLTIGDGHLGIWGALTAVFPESKEQRCWNHRIMNVLDKVSKKKQATAKGLLRRIYKAPSLDVAIQEKARFREWCLHADVEKAADILDQDWDRMVTYYGFPKEHWQHLRTTNVIESPFAAVRLRTNAAKRYRKVANATAVIWKTLMVVEGRFRRLNAPEKATEVLLGATYVNGVRVSVTQKDVAREEIAA